MATEEDSFEQVAAARKERLRALRAAQEFLEERMSRTVQLQVPKKRENLIMKFRNYVPRDKELQEGKLAPPVLPKFEDPVATESPQLKEELLVNIAPKKPNWDLRRDVQKKLERRTQKALYKLMEEQEKEKLSAEGGDDQVIGGICH